MARTKSLRRSLSFHPFEHKDRFIVKEKFRPLRTIKKPKYTEKHPVYIKLEEIVVSLFGEPDKIFPRHENIGQKEYKRVTNCLSGLRTGITADIEIEYKKGILIYPVITYDSTNITDILDYFNFNIEEKSAHLSLSSLQVDTSVERPIFLCITSKGKASVAVAVTAPPIELPVQTETVEQMYTFTPNALSFEYYGRSEECEFTHVWGALATNGLTPIPVAIHEDYGTHGCITIDKKFERETRVLEGDSLTQVVGQFGVTIPHWDNLTPSKDPFTLKSFQLCQDSYLQHTGLHLKKLGIEIPTSRKLELHNQTLDDIEFHYAIEKHRKWISSGSDISIYLEDDEAICKIIVLDTILENINVIDCQYASDYFSQFDFICSFTYGLNNGVYDFKHCKKVSGQLRVNETQIQIPGFIPQVKIGTIVYPITSETIHSMKSFSGSIALPQTEQQIFLHGKDVDVPTDLASIDNPSYELNQFLNMHELEMSLGMKSFVQGGTIICVELYRTSQQFDEFEIKGKLDNGVSVFVCMRFDTEKAWLRQVVEAKVDGYFVNLRFNNSWSHVFQGKLITAKAQGTFVDLEIN